MTQTNTPIRVGIIGAGQIGKHHINQYKPIDGVQIVAIADINEAEARRVADEHGIPNVYADFRDLLKRDDLDAVDVCLHNNLHMPVTVAALEAGLHVYCEKPMAGSYADAVTMLQAARDCDKMLAIQNMMLYYNETRAARALIDGGHLGKLYHARSSGFRRQGRPYVDGYGSTFFVQKAHAAGGALYDMGVYHLGQIMYLLDNPEVQTISGKVYQETAMDAARREGSGYDVEELGLGLVRMGDGITLDIVESWAMHLDKLEGSFILGSEGGVRLEPFGFFQRLAGLNLDSTADLERFAYRMQQVEGRPDVYTGAQGHWVAALRGQVDLLPSAEVSLNVMLISEGIYLSSHLGREVSADEVRAASVSTAMQV